MLTFNQVIENRINSVLAEIKGGVRKDGHHTVAVHQFVGKDVEYYKDSHQKARYALIIRTAKADVYEMVIASMPNVDGSWGSGEYYDIASDTQEGYYTIKQVIDEYLDKCQEYSDLYEIPC